MMVERSETDLAGGAVDAKLLSGMVIDENLPARSGAAPAEDAASGDKPASEVRTGLNPAVRDKIAIQLRAMYDNVARQPIPDRFAELIAKLDAAERKD